MTPIIGDLIESTVGKVVGKLTDKYLPASMSEQEKAQSQLEMQKMMIEEFKAFTDNVKATEPDAQYVPKYMNALRASVRPGIAWLSFVSFQGMLVYLTWLGKMDTQSFVSQAGALASLCIGFYFGQRHGDK